MHAGAYADGGVYTYVFSYSTRRDTATVRVIAKTIGLAISLSSASLNFNVYLGLSLKPERISE